jgi:hypothetical protein
MYADNAGMPQEMNIVVGPRTVISIAIDDAPFPSYLVRAGVARGRSMSLQPTTSHPTRRAAAIATRRTFAQLLFHDPVASAALLTGGLDFSNVDAIAEFYIGNAWRMRMAVQDPVSDSQPAFRQAPVSTQRSHAHPYASERVLWHGRPAESGKAFTASLDLLDRIARALGGRLAVEFEGVRTRAA